MKSLFGLFDRLFHLGNLLMHGAMATAPGAKLGMSATTMSAGAQSRRASPSAKTGPLTVSRTGPLTAAEALRQLQEGNRDYAENRSLRGNRGHVPSDNASSPVQPIAVVIGCADSRVPPEIVFDQGIGDLFVIRVAGNVCSQHVAGSAEFAIGVLNAPLIVVLGHTQCAAVSAATRHADADANMKSILHDIRPAVTSVKRVQPTLEGVRLIAAAIEANVRHTCRRLITTSPVIDQMVSSGQVAMVGAVYDVATGKVAWLDNVG